MERRASLSDGRHEARGGGARDPEADSGHQGRRVSVVHQGRADEARARKAELQSRLDAPEMPELLHPRMADMYREKVGSLSLARHRRMSDARETPAAAIRVEHPFLHARLLRSLGQRAGRLEISQLAFQLAGSAEAFLFTDLAPAHVE